jgi:hypothetical protein
LADLDDATKQRDIYVAQIKKMEEQGLILKQDNSNIKVFFTFDIFSQMLLHSRQKSKC